MPDDVSLEDFDFNEKPAEVPKQSLSVAALASATDDSESLADYLEGTVVITSKDQGLSKPWMKYHTFTLVKTVEEVKELVDRALAHGRCALDLETEGFDNRIDYKEVEGVVRPFTVHQIVGYCISLRGKGYYIPIRHQYNAVYGEKNPNVSIEGVNAEIKRLCQASQPVLTEEGFREDPLASSKIATPPKVVIFLWNAKFDQEFLFPVTGIDVWHPESFEDGMLAAYAVYSDDPDIGLKGKAMEKLSIEDAKGNSHAYEMIKFEELFPSNYKSKERKFYDLYPEDGSAIVLYGCSDAICTELLCEAKGNWEHTEDNLKYSYKHVVEPAKDPRHSFIYRLEKQTSQAVRDMERNRTKIDKKEVLVLLERAKLELAKYDDLITQLAKKNGFDEFNPGSSQQLSKFLFESDGLDISPKPERNPASGFYKTDAATLEKMAETPDSPPVLEWIVKYRQIDKIIGTYLASMAENCDKDDQLRFRFNQTGAATGRFTAPAGEPEHGYSGIPIHGIPARDDPKKPEVAHSLRRAFVAREGYTFVKVDYAGQELRIVANLSGEQVWIEEFLHGTGDLHTITAKAFFGPHVTKEHKVERNAGKIANFSLIYGGGVQAIMRATKCENVEAARRKANFDKSVPTFAGWVKGQHSFVKKNKGVWTAFKRFIAIPDSMVKPGDLDSKGNPITPQDAKKIQASCERKSTNFPIQGTGADIMKISMVKLLKEFHRRGWRREGGDDSVRMLMTVHDEIVFEIKHERLTEAVPIIIEIMESPWKMAKWRVPLVVEPLLGLTWEAKYDWEKVLNGKTAVPEWLVGTIVPGEAPPVTEIKEPVVTASSKPEASKPAPEAPSRESRGTKGTIKVATFALANTYLTNRTVEVLFESVAGSLDPDNGVFLKLIDNGGNVLIDPIQHRMPIIPERLKLRFQDRNLGSGEFQVRDEPL